MLRRNTPYGNIIYMLRLLENDRKTSFLSDLFSRSRYMKRVQLLMEDTRKGYLLSKIVYLRVRHWTSGRSLSEQSFIEQPPVISEQLLVDKLALLPCCTVFQQTIYEFAMKKEPDPHPLGADNGRKMQPGFQVRAFLNKIQNGGRSTKSRTVQMEQFFPDSNLTDTSV